MTRLAGAGARLLCALAALALVAADRAEACAICLSATVVTIGQKLDAADRAVLAVPLPGEDRFRVVAVVKGDIADTEVIADPALSADQQPLESGRALLLLRNRLAEQWSSAGAIGIEHAGWLRRLAATGGGDDVVSVRSHPLAGNTWSTLTDAAWRVRVALLAPLLESPDPLAAEIAYGEIARAPYAAMRSLRPLLDAAQIARWVDDPALASRRAAYTLLLGIAGGDADAALLEQKIDTAWRARDAANLAAMLAADLELRGPARVDFVERMYLADRERMLPEIEAALLALSVHGGANGTVPRHRVIEAFRFFIGERKPMAGFVAMDLADWEAWEVTEEYLALLKSNAIKDPASELAIVAYLQRSPKSPRGAALQPSVGQSD